MTNPKTTPEPSLEAKKAEEIVQEYYEQIPQKVFETSLNYYVFNELCKNNAIIHVKGILNLHTLDTGKGLMISGCNNDYLFWQGVLTILQS